MQRLLDDASKISGIKYDISSFADITDAIHVMQEEMGIAGATALEAGTTIQGSIGAMKGAWTNLITGLADGNADISQLVNNLVTTIVGDGTESNLGVIGNVLPAVKTALNGASKLVGSLLPKIVSEVPAIIKDNLPILAEAAVSLVQSLVEGISESKDLLLNTAFETIVFLAESLLELIPQLIEVGLNIISSLASGIAQNLPSLIPAIFGIINQLVATLTNPETLGNLLDAALALILALADSIVTVVPKLVDAVIKIVEGIVSFLLEPDNIVKLAEAAVEIVVAIAEGLVKSVGSLMGAVGDLISSVVEKFGETDWLEIGENIINGILDGLKNMWNSLSTWFSKQWDNLVGGVKDFLGIHSPSRVFAGIGKNMALGVGEGWEKTFGEIQDEIDGGLDFGNYEYEVVTSGANKSSSGARSGSQNVNVTVTIDENINAMGLARELLPYLKIAAQEAYL